MWYKIGDNQIIIEKKQNNTLSAILNWLEHFLDDEEILILPSDHIVEDEKCFVNTINQSRYKTESWMIIFGIKPKYWHTWYWYIDFKQNEKIPYKVNYFKEKPNKKLAEEYISKWFYWNSWILLFKKAFFINELKNVNLEYYNIYFSNTIESKILPNLSVDYWLLEKSNKVYVSTIDTIWYDMGTYETFHEYLNDQWISIQNQHIINHKHI